MTLSWKSGILRTSSLSMESMASAFIRSWPIEFRRNVLILFKVEKHLSFSCCHGSSYEDLQQSNSLRESLLEVVAHENLVTRVARFEPSLMFPWKLAFLRCSSNTSSNCATKSTNPRKIPGLVEPSVSSLPRRANSKTPQNLTHWMSRFKMCRFLFISSLWRHTASLYPSSSWVAMFTLPKPQNFRQLSMCSFACSCFF